MIFTQYDSAKVFALEVSDTLNRHEIQNNLLFKNIHDGLQREDNSNMVMATVKDEAGRVLLTAVRTIPFPMVMYETDNVRNDRVTHFFAESLVKHEIDVDYFMTEKDLARDFCETYGTLNGKKYYNNQSLALFLLDKVNDVSSQKGFLRKANENDMFYLPFWYADFIPACHIGDYDLDGGIRNAGQAVSDGRLYVWVDGVPVSCAASGRQTSNCIFIGNVYTPPNLRGRGYSTACIAQLSQRLLDNGWKFCGLYADCANPYSNKVYRKVGYREVFYYDQYKLC